LCLFDGFDDVLIQPSVPHGAIVALNVGILLGLPGLDMQYGNPLFPSPFHQLFTDVFRAVARSEQHIGRGYGRLRSPKIA